MIVYPRVRVLANADDTLVIADDEATVGGDRTRGNVRSREKRPRRRRYRIVTRHLPTARFQTTGYSWARWRLRLTPLPKILTLLLLMLHLLRRLQLLPLLDPMFEAGTSHAGWSPDTSFRCGVRSS